MHCFATTGQKKQKAALLSLLKNRFSFQLNVKVRYVLFYEAGFIRINEHRVWQLDLQIQKQLIKLNSLLILGSHEAEISAQIYSSET